MDQNTKAQVRDLAVNLAAAASLNMQFVYTATLNAVDVELDRIFEPEPDPGSQVNEEVSLNP
jgi:hypothetical protein